MQGYLDLLTGLSMQKNRRVGPEFHLWQVIIRLQLDVEFLPNMSGYLFASVNHPDF
jgi:hypothetical protein